MAFRLTKPSTCKGCPLETLGTGFMEVSGTGKNKVLLVGEALGQDEAEQGFPFVGKAGAALDKMMTRGGLNRDDFKIANVVWCRPPNNKLSGEDYAYAAIQHCAPYLNKVIEEFKPNCIVALGTTAFRRLLPEIANLHGVGLLDSKKHKGARGYFFRSDRYSTWIIPTVHPSYVMRGKTSWAQVLIHDIQRATEVARDGYYYTDGDYLLDPTPTKALAWVEEFEEVWEKDHELFLSCDIETPQKGSDEEELDLEDGNDYIILRCGYSYRDYSGLSIPWGGMYSSIHQRLLGHPCTKLWWNGCPTPDQKILTADLRWIEAGALKIGDSIVSIEEEKQEANRLRRYKTGKITANSRALMEVFKVTLSDGAIIKVTGEHPWLIKKRGGQTWKKTEDLNIRDTIPRLLKTWEEDLSKDAGYLSGIYDGEGSLSVQEGFNTLTLNFSQNIGPTLDKVLALLEAKGIPFKVNYPKRAKDRKNARVHIYDRTTERARFLGTIRPERLVSKFIPEMLGSTWTWVDWQCKIVAVESLGIQEIVRLGVDCHTYILEGFGAHNSYDIPRILAAK